MFSMIEIYKEKIRDLFRPKTPSENLKIKDDKSGGTMIQNLHKEIVYSKQNVLKLLLKGEKRRTVHEVLGNGGDIQKSSRSHVIIMFEIMQKFPNDKEKRGVLNLVDLACSEKVKIINI